MHTRAFVRLEVLGRLQEAHIIGWRLPARRAALQLQRRRQVSALLPAAEALQLEYRAVIELARTRSRAPARPAARRWRSNARPMSPWCAPESAIRPAVVERDRASCDAISGTPASVWPSRKERADQPRQVAVAAQVLATAASAATAPVFVRLAQQHIDANDRLHARSSAAR